MNMIKIADSPQLEHDKRTREQESEHELGFHGLKRIFKESCGKQRYTGQMAIIAGASRTAQ